MFRQLVTSQLDRVRSLLDGSRNIADWTVISPNAERDRGIDIDFLNENVPPNWLVEQAEVSGVMQVDGVEYELSGVLENISGEPVKTEEPLVARLKLDGPQQVRIDYNRHTTSDRTWDELTMHWPSLPISALALGDSADASIRMQPGNLELWVEMTIEGDRVRGRMLSKLRNTRISSSIKSNEYNEVLIASLTRSLSEVRQIDVEAKYNGTWSAMDIDVASNLSNVFTSSLKSSFASQTEATKQKLVGELNEAYRTQVGELQVWDDGATG